MFPQRISRSEFRPDEVPPDPSHTLELHIRAGFPPDLALDLVLNEIVVRAAEATHASAAALALVRGDEDEMVCRAATGPLAPGLGIPLNPRDGLSGACLQSREPQLSVDTECDPRVDSDVSKRLGIRSILAVPVFDVNGAGEFSGVLEVFSPSPAAFSSTHQKLLEDFAHECARVRQAALELGNIVAVDSSNLGLLNLVAPSLTPSDFTPPDFMIGRHLTDRRLPHETWALALGSLTIFAAIALSFLIGFRVGWLSPHRSASSSQIEQPSAAQQGPVPSEFSSPTRSPADESSPAQAEKSFSEKSSSRKSSAKSSSPRASEKGSGPSSATRDVADGDLVVYEKGKVVFRLKPGPAGPMNHSVTEAASIDKLAPNQSVWLDPAQAEARLQNRTEPQYPAAALAAHQTGDVRLEVQVAEDGSIRNIRLLSGDPILAAAATEAVRNWRYQPYRVHDHPLQFQTDITLTFALPN
ncbi:MAG: TonB family protein [Terriglobales bacterium]